MDDFALTPAERALFAALNRREVRFLVVGMGAAVLQGAPFATHGLGDFGAEYARADEHEIEGVRLRVLPIEGVIASKQATRRDKDLAQLPALEATRLARMSKPGR